MDGVAEDESVFCGASPIRGLSKGGQRHKIASASLKLITVARDRSGVRSALRVAYEHRLPIE